MKFRKLFVLKLGTFVTKALYNENAIIFTIFLLLFSPCLNYWLKILIEFIEFNYYICVCVCVYFWEVKTNLYYTITNYICNIYIYLLNKI